MQLETHDDRKVSDINPLPVMGAGAVIDVTLSLDTGAYADGDVLADTQSVGNAVRNAAGRAFLQSLVVIDESDQKQGFDLLFLDANNSLGAENAAPSIGDAEALAIIGRVPVSAADYYDLGGVAIANLNAIGLMLKAASGRTLYVAAISRGAGTYGASAIKLKLGLVWD
jgi:hypothetical protein